MEFGDNRAVSETTWATVRLVLRVRSEGEALLDAIEAVPVPDALVYAWGGGEMKSMRQIGRHLRKTWGLKTASISATGYWRVGESAED